MRSRSLLRRNGFPLEQEPPMADGEIVNVNTDREELKERLLHISDIDD